MENYINSKTFKILTIMALAFNVLARLVDNVNLVIPSLIISILAIGIGLKAKDDNSILRRVLLILNFIYIGLFVVVLVIVQMAGGARY